MKTLFFLVALLAPAIAQGEWVKLTSASGGEATVYVDPATIKRDGHVVGFSTLVDYATVRTLSGEPFQSATMQNEIDCAGRMNRTLSVSSHSEAMAGGHVVSTSAGQAAWAPIAKKTIVATTFDFVCNKKRFPDPRKVPPKGGGQKASLIDV